MKDLSDLTAQCIRCGLCLESCPTFTETGNEAESPRGRIYLIRCANEGVLPWKEDVRRHIDACLGCRSCETVCPSGVEYGAILELARARFERETPRRIRKAFVMALATPWVMRLELALAGLWPGEKMPGFVSRILSGREPEAESPRLPDPAPWPPMEESELPPVRGEVYMLEGCAMGVLFPDVHEATRRLLRRVGYRVRHVDAGCCGSMHAHCGYLDEAGRLARKLAAAMPDDLPVVVNSAGCGSTMKEYGRLFGDALQPFADRVVDAGVFLQRAGLEEALRRSPGVQRVATYHDACHLAHGQGVRIEPRKLLKAVPGLTFVELPESDVCCGSAGTYNITEPRMARRLVERKWRNVHKTGASIVVTGNPGCQTWIGQVAREKNGGVRVMHTLDLLESSFSGLRVP